MRDLRHQLTDCMERTNVVEDENFLHLVWNIVSEVFDESVDVDVTLGKDIKYWQPCDFRKASVAEVDYGISLDVSSSDLKERKT